MIPKINFEGNKYLEKKYGHLKNKNANFKNLPEVYFRIGLPKKVKNKYLTSRNHYLGGIEDGISVFNGRYSPNSKFIFVDLESDRGFMRETYSSFQEEMQLGSKKKVYLLEGNPLLSGDGGYQVGADLERLLSTKGLKIIGELDPNKIIVNDEGTTSRKNKSIILYDQTTLSGKDLKKYPKYADGGNLSDIYDYQEDYYEPKKYGEISYKFINDNDDVFNVSLTNINKKDKSVVLDFEGNYSWKTLKNSNPFKTLRTVSSIIKYALKKLSNDGFTINKIIYDATEKKAKIYQLMILKEFPNAKFKINQFGSDEVKLYGSKDKFQYKNGGNLNTWNYSIGGL